jgi:hypothetical protein
LQRGWAWRIPRRSLRNRLPCNPSWDRHIHYIFRKVSSYLLTLRFQDWPHVL